MLTDAMLADNISTDSRGTHGIPSAFYHLFSKEKKPQKDQLSLTTSPTGSFSICLELH